MALPVNSQALLYRWGPGYRSGSDRDNGVVACE